MTLNSRSIEIINQLLNKKELSLKSLAEFFNVSTRTIRYDIEKINIIFKEHKLQGIEKKGDILFLSFPLNTKEYKKILSIYTGLSQEERFDLILAKLLLNRKLILESLVHELDVTRRTLNNDIANIRIFLKEKDIIVKSSTTEGLIINGSEKNIRILLIETLIKIHLKEKHFSQVQKIFLKNIFNKISHKLIDEFCWTLSLDNIYIFDYSYSVILMIIASSKIRNRKIEFKNLLENFSLTNQFFKLKTTLSPTLKEFLDDFDIFLLTNTIYNANYKTGIKEPKFKEFSNNLKEKFNLNFEIDSKTLQNIYSLIKVALYKIDKKIEETHTSLENLPTSYLSIYSNLKIIINKFFGEFYEEDLVVITILFKNYLDSKKIVFSLKKNILIIDTSSNNWKGKIIKQYLNNLFQIETIEIIEIYSFEKFINFKNFDFDLILSLDNFDLTLEKNISFVQMDFYKLYSNPYILENFGLLRKTK